MFTMKHLLLTTIAAVVVVGCGGSKGEQLFYAALEGRTKDVELYLDNGASAGAEIRFQKRFPWSKGIGSATPLHVAKTKEIAQLLITQGASIEAIVKGDESAGFGQGGRYSYGFFTGETPLHTHAGEGRKEVVKILINAGANVNAKNDSGSTPLIAAAFDGDKEIVKLLIAKGANVNPKTDLGNTPLHSAALNGRKEIVELLIANGADVNANNVAGVTPLHWAAQEGQKEIAELLIAKGADVNAKDESGKTPLDRASEATPLNRAMTTETADLLRKHGGKTGEELNAEGK